MKTIQANDGKTYALPDNPVWRKGPPPKIGWWPASPFRSEAELLAAANVVSPWQIRWFDGEQFGSWVHPNESEIVAQSFALDPSIVPKCMFWTDRWWLNQPEGFPK